MTKVISFSLWGDSEKYTIGAIRNAEIAIEIYPDWVCRYYVGLDVPPDILTKLQNKPNTQLYFMTEDPNWNGMFWRFFAADKDDVVISRDTDSRLGEREKAAVDEWLASDKDFHIIRDHPYHRTEILGGMWGVRNGLLKGIQDMIADYDKGDYDNKYQVDQNFLREVVYPMVADKATVHDPYFQRMPFPMERANAQDFVGQVYNEYEEPQF